MKAIIQHAFGGPEVLKYEEVPTPTPGPRDILIEVRAVSVNTGLDFPAREGKYARPVKLPHVLGVDPVGVVRAVGSQVKGRKPGDRIWFEMIYGCGECPICLGGNPRACRSNGMIGITKWGGYAQYCVAPEINSYLIPDGLDFPEACVVARHFPTAMYLLDDQAKLQKDEWVLVMGAAGGLGNACVQVARFMGAKVIAGAGSDERAAYALEGGADFAVNYRKQDLAAEVRRLTGEGVHVVCENIADPDLWPGAFNSLRRNGRLVTTGAHGGGTVPLDVKRLYLQRITILGGSGAPREAISRSFQMAIEGKLRAGIDRVMPLSEAAEAHRIVMRGEALGKVVLTPEPVAA
jgi:NADPH:quinone reductase